MSELAVFETRPAAQPLAAWLQRMLLPVCAAVRLQPLPLEIRPTGRWAGWAQHGDYAPDGRVILSSKIVFWTNESIISIYLHEACHRILEGRNVTDHGPEFVALNAVLLARCKEFFRHDAFFQIDLYDFHDCPIELAHEPSWRGLVLNFGIETAATFADEKTDADELASKVIEAWQGWLSRRECQLAAGVLQVNQAAKSAVLQAELASLRRDVLVYFWAGGIGFASILIAICYVAFLEFSK